MGGVKGRAALGTRLGPDEPNGGKRLSALPAFTERAVATPDPARADLICLDAVGEFGRPGLVALRRASVTTAVR